MPLKGGNHDPEIITHHDKLLTIDTFLEGLLHPGIKAHPLFLDPYNGVLVLRTKFALGITLPLHFHTGCVHAFTLSGCWYYTEYPDQKQTAGSYLFEPGGSVHQFTTLLENTEDTDAIFVMTGANVNFGSEVRIVLEGVGNPVITVADRIRRASL